MSYVSSDKLILKSSLAGPGSRYNSRPYLWNPLHLYVMSIVCWLSCTDLLQGSQPLLRALGLRAQTGSAVATCLVTAESWWRWAAVVGAEAHNDAEVPRGVEACCN